MLGSFARACRAARPGLGRRRPGRGGGATALVLWLSGLETIPATPAFVLKIAYGAVLGAIVTHRSVAGLIGAAR